MPLLGEPELPNGFDPAHVFIASQSLHREGLLQHGLPGVELEDGEDLVFGGVGVDEALAGFVPADVLHEHLAGGQAGLLCGITKVGNREAVFGVIGAGKVDRLL
jgi:hypothetical protein